LASDKACTIFPLNAFFNLFKKDSGLEEDGLNEDFVRMWKDAVITYHNTECPRRNVPDFGRVFLMLKYTDITQNTYVQS